MLDKVYWDMRCNYNAHAFYRGMHYLLASSFCMLFFAERTPFCALIYLIWILSVMGCMHHFFAWVAIEEENRRNNYAWVAPKKKK